jgi:hypothetical protein
MATTRHILVMETTDKARGTTGRFRLKAKLAVGLAILGCAAALAFGGAQVGSGARSQPQAGQPAAGILDWEQVERTQIAPLSPVAILDWEQAERAQVAPSQSVMILDWEQAERMQVAPALPLLDWEQVERTQVAP